MAFNAGDWCAVEAGFNASLACALHAAGVITADQLAEYERPWVAAITGMGFEELMRVGLALVTVVNAARKVEEREEKQAVKSKLLKEQRAAARANLHLVGADNGSV